jgi:hypothetical protein
MYGNIIGMVPKHFIIVLIENHSWYENSRTTMGRQISDAYNTSRRRSTVPGLKPVVNPTPVDNRINPSGKLSGAFPA